MNKPTQAQKTFLTRVIECPASFREQFPYGAHCQMLAICEQNKWVVYEGQSGKGGGYRITNAGRAAIGHRAA